MPVIKKLKKKGMSALTKAKGKNTGKLASGGTASGAAKAKKAALNATKRKRAQVSKGQFNVDAWDTGAVERLEHEKAARSDSSKRIRFEPAPATLVLPSKEAELRKRMGEFAGPLLGALWDEKPKIDSINFQPRKEAPPASQRNANKFAVLSMDSDEENISGSRAPDAAKDTVFFKPSALDVTQAPKATPKEDLFAFKPSVLDASALLKASNSSLSTTANPVAGNPFTTLEFKSSGLQIGSHADRSLMQPSAPSLAPSSTPSFSPPQFTFQPSAFVNHPTKSEEDFDDL